MMLKKLLFSTLSSSIFLLFSCKKVDVNFGSEFVDNETTQIIKVDTFSVNMSTVKLDSFPVNNKTGTLAGGYTDPIFGKISTMSFMEFSPAEYNNETFPISSTFDSITLLLKPNGYFYGDTSKPLHIEIHQLAEKLIAPDNGSYFYNTSNYRTGKLLGSTDVTVKPTRNPTDTIRIRLSDDLGKLFLSKMMMQSDLDIKSSTAFIEFFNGIRISSGNANNQLVIGCNDGAIMRLYYKRTDAFDARKTYDFSMTNKSNHFNRIVTDRTGTILEKLNTQKEIPSTETNNAAYTQSATGTMIKLRFPSIRNLLVIPNYAKVLSARLVVRPVKNSFSTMYYLPPALRLTTTNVFNQIGTDLTYISANGSSAVQLGTLQIDNLYGNNTYYSYDLSTYIKLLVNDATSENLNGLLLVPPSPAFETQVSRLVAGSRQNAENKVQLEIYYVAIK